MLFSSISLLFALPFIRAAVVQTPHDSHDHDHSHEVEQSLPGTWYHEPHHSVHTLFKRAPGDGTNYAPVGTPGWSAGFPPPGPPDPSRLPEEWVAALNAAVAAGKIPDIPRSSNTPQTNPVYPPGVNPNSPQVCSATYKCRIPGDIWDSPDGVFSSSFDDGPLPLTPTLVDFLQAHGQRTTHFMIGINIIYYPSQFLKAFDANNDIAVHTWSHPYMTTLSNLDIIGQLGWTMQLIHNSTGGRVPRYWRPPYGDSDMRVRSIAKEVFGLETVIWNHDTEDWRSTTPQIQASMTQFLLAPKSPGVMILQHETSDITVNGFIQSYPMIAANGWNFQSLAEAISGGRIYQNADSSSSDDVDGMGIVDGAPEPSSSSTDSPSATSNTASSTPTNTSQNLQPSPSKTSSALSLRSTISRHVVLSSLFVSALSVVVLFS